MNNNFNITLDDVKDFLSTLGYAWNGAIILNGGCGCAEDLSDFNNNREMLTSMRLHTPEGAMIKDVMITGISFTFYNKSLDHSDIDATMEYEVEKDHTEQWIQFLLQRYGNNYRNYVKKLCKRMKHETVNNAKHEFERIKEIKAEIVRNLRAKLNHYQHIEDLVDTQELKR